MNATLIRWELTWTLVEACAVGLALWALLGTSFTTSATFALFGICAVSAIVRTRHYLRLSA